MDENVEEMRKRKKTKRKYPLPRADMSLENEIATLKGLVQFSNKGEKPVKYDEIKVPKIHPTRVSVELKFFASIGLAERKKGGKYVPTKQAIEFVNALNWKEEDAKQVIRGVLLGSWFGDLVVKMLNISKEASLSDIISELGKTVEGIPEKDEKAIKRLVEWLEYAEIIEIDENDMVHLKEAHTYKEETEIPQYEKTGSEIKSKESVAAMKIKEGKALTLNLAINIQIDSETDIEKIREIIRIIKQNLIENVEG